MSLNVLLVQDSASGALAVREALKSARDGSFQLEWVRSWADGRRSLSQQGNEDSSETPSISGVLVNLFLPDSRGIETFDRLFETAPHIPILVLCAPQHEDIARLAVQHGAQDYLLNSLVDRYHLPKAIISMVERAANAEVLFEEKERAQVTLNSIGDAVMSTNVRGRVTYLNSVAERLTGWTCAEAVGRPVEDVFRIVDAFTRETVRNPMTLALRLNKTVALTPNCVLIRRDGVEAGIEDSAAPIHDRRGNVTGAVIVFHDVSAARAILLKISYLAQHDALTTLPNRLLLNDRLTQAIALAQRRQQQLGVLFLDIDRFKHVNDSLGHDVGDRLLISVAHRLLACVRSSDTVSRQGGDEFVILLSEVAHAQDAALSAEKIILALAAPYRLDQHDIHITVSIGIATYPDDGVVAETLMKHADFAMYHAKESGRNNYQFFKPDMNASAMERQLLEGELRHAVDRHEFVLHYQPKVNLKTGAIVGVEALVRWRHPQRGLVPPADFIPIAEECGFVGTIGHWVLREACHQARLWQQAGLIFGSIAVNISAFELRAREFVVGVREILLATGLEPHSLELELTETFLMQDTQATATVLHSLKDLGVRLALDDFGTGYASLSHLKRFPIDSLKIDQSFVRSLTTDADDASIVTAVISMGRSLHMRVVAEGVESREQLAFLQARGCPEGQGYYLSRPLGADDFAQLLKRGMAEVEIA
jgi:diguanylate cyclase (GGDEF)-like protein/PAS domain S-box-containing protein